MKYIYILGLIGLIISCSTPPSKIVVIDSKLYIEPTDTESTYHIEVNTNNILQEGIILPNKGGNLNSTFKLAAKISITSERNQEYFYKLFYQNTSYKYIDYNEKGEYNPKSSENFYGSWEDVNIGFKSMGVLDKSSEINIIDSFRIVGNPRNETKYYGIPKRPAVTKELINENINRIKNNKEWIESVITKASSNKISTEEQLYLDALWQISYSLESDYTIDNYNNEFDSTYNQILNNGEWNKLVQEKANKNNISFLEQATKEIDWVLSQQGIIKPINHRYKRNPRMGDYEVLLVVLSKEELDKIPVYVKDIGYKDKNQEEFVNPMFYIKEKLTKNHKESIVQTVPQKINASMNLDGKSGIYVDPLSVRNPNYSKEAYTQGVNDGQKLYEEALFSQYFHVINKDFELKNIPIVSDVVNEPYTRKKYEFNKRKFSLEERDVTHTKITNAPGKTVFYNDSMGAIQIVNPGSKTDLRKENVGVMTRIGLTYGKYTAKIWFPDLVNNENIWNGVTCAFWLFSEDMHSWNARDVCTNLGYLPKGAESHSEDRKETTTYSEIDIEIVKTSKYWPKTSYVEPEMYKKDNPESNSNLIITTTNWDLACRDPKNFNQGVNEISKDDKTFQLHRWDNWYQALTSKYEYQHDETVGKILYYQIEWKPNEIIWRIGPDKENLDLIGYMDSDNTKIPNNQMIAIITQEFHYSKWWPLSPFDQNNIPYPKNDINGYIYSIEVE